MSKLRIIISYASFMMKTHITYNISGGSISPKHNQGSGHHVIQVRPLATKSAYRSSQTPLHLGVLEQRSSLVSGRLRNQVNFCLRLKNTSDFYIFSSLISKSVPFLSSRSPQIRNSPRSVHPPHSRTRPPPSRLYPCCVQSTLFALCHIVLISKSLDILLQCPADA